MEGPVRSYLTDLIVGGRTYGYQTDMEAIEMAEQLPDCVRWQVRLQHDRGVVDSEKYRSTRKTTSHQL